MCLIKVTKIYEGATGVVSSCGHKAIGYEFAKEVGLLRHSAFLYDVREGESVLLPIRELDALREAGRGIFEFVIEHPKYANQHLYSDVIPYEVIEWETSTRMRVRRMKTSGYYGAMGENCDTYEPDEDGEIITIREHKNGRYYEANTNCCPFIPSDEPYYYRDPSF